MIRMLLLQEDGAAEDESAFDCDNILLVMMSKGKCGRQVHDYGDCTGDGLYICELWKLVFTHMSILIVVKFL